MQPGSRPVHVLLVLVMVSRETRKAAGELNSLFSRQIRESAFLKLLIKIAYKDCIFDEIRHCVLPLDPGSTGWKLLVLWYD